jgi:hypothetical protein
MADLEQSAEQLFGEALELQPERRAGTPAGDKHDLVLDTPHDVTEQRPQLVKAVLDWLDHYLDA